MTPTQTAPCEGEAIELAFAVVYPDGFGTCDDVIKYALDQAKANVLHTLAALSPAPTAPVGVDREKVIEIIRAEMVPRKPGWKGDPAVCADAIMDLFASASPQPGEGGSGASKWGAARNLFVSYAERFTNATRYEEASAIADDAARKFDALYDHPAPGDTERLRASLEPFARAAEALGPSWMDHEDHWSDYIPEPPTVGDLRAAHAALSQAENSQKTGGEA
jgi:hypothetical protein